MSEEQEEAAAPAENLRMQGMHATSTLYNANSMQTPRSQQEAPATTDTAAASEKQTQPQLNAIIEKKHKKKT